MLVPPGFERGLVLSVGLVRPLVDAVVVAWAVGVDMVLVVEHHRGDVVEHAERLADDPPDAIPIVVAQPWEGKPADLADQVPTQARMGGEFCGQETVTLAF